ncbi:ubiquinol oxidase subunit II [Salinicola salarius]|uniref:ubiquinol oxidase subunit II n=1 Tax=Salinicola salarius TaxID=430457 RepID=UPI0026EF7E56|nr:ubiquinol oxidase subunit II [Salinicola salarius]
MSHSLQAIRTALRCRALLAASLAALLGGCSQGSISFLDPQGPIAQAQRDHFWFVVLMTLIVVAPVILQTPFIVWRYRYGGKGTYRPHWDRSRWLDIAMWGIPVAVVIVLAVVLWRETHQLDPYRPLESDRQPLQVQVVGFDWKWLFIYPEQGIASMGQLVLPEDRPIAFQLTSATVLQSFFIPALGSQIDVMNRMVTKLHLQADNTGRFQGKNMQYNGSGFHRQRFMTQVVDDAQFDDFVAHARRDGYRLDRQRFTQLNEKSDATDFAAMLGIKNYQHGDLMAFSPIPSRLFDAIAHHAPIDWTSLTPSPPQNRKTMDERMSPSNATPAPFDAEENTHDEADDNGGEKAT